MSNTKLLVEKINREYINAACELNFKNNYQLIVAVILSARCTDKRVNKITPKLFEKYPTISHLAAAKCGDVEKIILPCGFYQNKAKNLIKMAEQVVQNYGGEIPNSKQELMSLAGVGEKTANVVLACGFNIPAIAVDTHVFRVSNRLGLAKAKTVKQTQLQLEKNVDKSQWIKLHYALVLHGRYVCKAINPKCKDCPFSSDCAHKQLTK